ncbi:DUF4339 domain-containing protein [Verrucomicrobiaceae bacterium N1E253]|uniref:DUF4339 domain-containing protein n=1 Tax=Oceaniferula marina TaxID=2748318 RepID=A0A851GGS5_9BACT|nr:GYF domain-containing protein [Oceaniferula marina]NWK56399.1 DUF4339 domain-containing protein [Oceaniferula marina]
MSDSDQWHYTDKTGKQSGPIPTRELLALIAAKEVPMSAMAWKDGMPQWKPVSQIEELHTQVAPQVANTPQPPTSGAAAPTPQAPQAASTLGTTASSVSPTQASPQTSPEPAAVDPYETPNTPHNPFHDVPDRPLSYDEIHGYTPDYGGIGRLAYFLLNFLFGAGFVFAFMSLGLFGAVAGTEGAAAMSYLGIFGLYGAYILITLILAGKRLKNTGCSAWLALLSFIPLANIWVSIRCICAPPGYSDTKKLDTAGIILFCLFVLAPILLFVVALAMGAIAGPPTPAN